MQTQQLQNERMNMAMQNMTQAINGLIGLKDAIGADTIIGPTNTAAYQNQADIELPKL